MKAIIYEKYGDPSVLQLKEIAKPTPRDNEVLIRIHATTVTSADCRIRSLNVPVGFGLMSRLVFGIRKPRYAILGTEFAGEIVAIGDNVIRFKIGDPVFGMSGIKMGCYAEYKCIPEDGMIALTPTNLSYAEAAALPFGGTTALDFFRRGRLQRGEKVLINGASGAVGIAAVQLANYFGAEVTGICSERNINLVRSLGAKHAIDYTKEDFTYNGETYDLIVDTVGTAPFSRCKHSLNKGGRLLMVLAGLPDMLLIPWQELTSNKKIIAGPVKEKCEDLRLLAELAEKGVFKPVIDRRYLIEQASQAHHYVDSKRKKGNVILTL